MPVAPDVPAQQRLRDPAAPSVFGVLGAPAPSASRVCHLRTLLGQMLSAGVTQPHAGLSPLHRKAARVFPLGAHPGETEMKLDGDMGRFVWCCAGTWEVTVPASHLDFCSAVTLCPRSCPTTPPSPIFAVTVEPTALPGSSWAQTPSTLATRVGVISM